jgi:hypothetical protein
VTERSAAAARDARENVFNIRDGRVADIRPSTARAIEIVLFFATH